MIREIRGNVLGSDTLGATIEVAGFGIYVHLPDASSLATGQEVRILTHLAVKQDGLELYGFLTEADRAFFMLALQVSGVGPKTALNLLRRAPRERLEEAIRKRDLSYLTKIAGLGKKSAEKLMVEIGEKVGQTDSGQGGDDAEIFDTLVALGYTEREARKALSNIPESLPGKDERLKAALSSATR